MVVLKNVLKNKYVKAVIDGLSCCIIGVIGATGCFMLLENLLPEGLTKFSAFNIRALILAVILGGIYWGARKVRKKGISPITLIIISAVLGIAVYW